MRSRLALSGEDRGNHGLVGEQDDQSSGHEERAEWNRPPPGCHPDDRATCRRQTERNRREARVGRPDRRAQPDGAAGGAAPPPPPAPPTTAALTSPNPIEAGDTRCSVSTGSVIARAPRATPASSSASFGRPTTESTSKAMITAPAPAPTQASGRRRSRMSTTAAGTSIAMPIAPATGTVPSADATTNAVTTSAPPPKSSGRTVPCA
jgi:hypothetical protein